MARKSVCALALFGSDLVTIILALQIAIAVRDKVVQAYQEIGRMAI